MSSTLESTLPVSKRSPEAAEARASPSVRAPYYWRAPTETTCLRCHAETEVVTFMLPPGHERLEPVDGDDEEGDNPSVWTAFDEYAVVFHVVDLCESALRAVRHCPAFRIGADPEGEPPCWGNHCTHCEVRMEDEELFHEADVAFVPWFEAGARRVHLLRIDEPFEADAGCVAVRPDMVALMSRE